MSRAKFFEDLKKDRKTYKDMVDFCCDKRIGWEDADYLCIVGYSKVSNKEGFEKYYGGKYESGACVGIFATKYPKEPYIKY